MKERPILFNGEMVRAILAGKKTQTRRVVDLRNSDIDSKFFAAADFGKAWADPSFPNDQYLHVPAKEDYDDFDGETHRVRCKTQSGDRLWVRETFRGLPKYDDTFVYRADWTAEAEEYYPEITPWTPSIHMPRWASRLTLEVTAVRVERLQDISEADAMVEGFPDPDGLNREYGDRARYWFQHLWRSIYGDASWDANPWVWVYEFKIAERKGEE